jgi:hypothetical protein
VRHILHEFNKFTKISLQIQTNVCRTQKLSGRWALPGTPCLYMDLLNGHTVLLHKVKVPLKIRS